ncbi:FAD-dependent oxidoreductase [Candidatus Roizmanbacteria bacterium]|nr:FAD-dependent oxidoreductase [Candidatus Roizmanbacteria bacterium]
MNIAIIGAGFTGLSTAYHLAKKGHKVTIFEKDPLPGGLAVGYQEKNWDWTLEKHYHHWFTNDKYVLTLAREIGQEVIFKTPKTSVYLDNKIYQLDSPLALLKFSKLPLLDRLQMGAALALLRYNPFWKPLEKIRATAILPKVIGKKGWEMIWKPQLVNKMGKFADEVSLVWFWTRINKRTTSLAYPVGGYLIFAQKIVQKIKDLGGEVYFNTAIESLTEDKKDNLIIKTNKKTYSFDKAIVTLPSYLFLKITPQLPETYKNKLIKLKGLGATDLVLRLKKQFLTDGTYWLSICQKDSPVLVVVEHTNLMDKKSFNNEHLVYLGNYTETTNKKILMNKNQLLDFYDPLLKKINPNYRKNIIDFELFKAPFTQPIVPINYSKLLPPMTTPLKNVYLANIEQVYPWDRGTNYAVELGEKVAKLV